MSTEYIPYQKCPKCDGQGIVSKPPHIAGDVFEYTSSAITYTCDICDGKKIIKQCVIERPK